MRASASRTSVSRSRSAHAAASPETPAPTMIASRIAIGGSLLAPLRRARLAQRQPFGLWRPQHADDEAEEGERGAQEHGRADTVDAKQVRKRKGADCRADAADRGGHTDRGGADVRGEQFVRIDP